MSRLYTRLGGLLVISLVTCEEINWSSGECVDVGHASARSMFNLKVIEIDVSGPIEVDSSSH